MNSDWKCIGSPYETGGSSVDGDTTSFLEWDYQIKKIYVYPAPYSNSQSNRLLITTSKGIYSTNNAEAPNPDDVEWERECDHTDLDSPYDSTWSALRLTTYDIELMKDPENYFADDLLFATGTAMYVNTNNQTRLRPVLLVAQSDGEIWSEWTLPVMSDDDGIFPDTTYLRCDVEFSEANPYTLYLRMCYLRQPNANAIYREDITMTLDLDFWSSTYLEWTILAKHDMMSTDQADSFDVSPYYPNQIAKDSDINASYSVNSGQSYAGISMNHYHADVEDIEFSADGTKLWLATHGGISSFDITDSLLTGIAIDTNWTQHNNGLANAEMIGFSSSATHPEEMAIGLYHDQSWVTDSPYQPGYVPQWKAEIVGDGLMSYINDLDFHYQYVTGHDSNTVRMSSNGGTSFGAIESIPGTNPQWNHWFAQDYADTSVLYKSKRELWRHNGYGSSNVPGADWQQISNFTSWGFTNLDSTYLPQTRRMYNHPKFPNSMYAFVHFISGATGNTRELLFYNDSINYAIADTVRNRWHVLSMPPYSELSDCLLWTNDTSAAVWPHWPGMLVIDDEDPQKFLCTFYGYNWNCETAHDKVFEYDNGTWTDISYNLPNCSADGLVRIAGSDELLLGTDFGVFYTNDDLINATDSVKWLRYAMDLPNTDVTHLEANYVINTIRAATNGRGLWEAPLPCAKRESPLVISDGDNKTIDYFSRLRRDIVIESGGKLTITNTVQFAPHCAIIVETGGKLVVDGGHLTNACPGEMWQGIIVYGTGVTANQSISGESQSPSSNQGKVVLKNGAVVENAHTGVWCVTADANCNAIPNSGGGIVQASSTTFLNCYVGVELTPYIWKNTSGSPSTNKSYFSNCDFKTTRTLDASPLVAQPNPKAGLLLDGVYRIKINGCRFVNEATFNPEYESAFADYHKRGDGIRSHSATYIIADGCSNPPLQQGQPCDPQDLLHTEFTNLYHGIRSLCGDYVATFSVRNAIFTDNICGVRTEGSANGPSIYSNTFHINPLINEWDQEEVLGVDVQNTTGFEIEENHFIGYNLNNSLTTIGAAFNETAYTCGGLFPYKWKNNVVYRNWFDNLDEASHVENENATTTLDGDNYGLEYRCNKFGQQSAITNTDIYLLSNTTIQIVQGSYLPGAEAGNLFSDNCSGNSMGHFDIGANSTIVDRYFHNLDSVPALPPFIAPYCYDGDEVIPEGTNDPYDELSVCPVSSSDIKIPSAMLVKMAEVQDIYQDVKGIYTNHINGGNTAGLISFINNSNNESIEVRNELIACKPYVSDNAWRAAFMRNPPLNSWHMAQALLYNSPLKQTVINMMNQYNFDEYYRELVMNGQGGGVSNKDLLEADLCMYNRERQVEENDYFKHYLLWNDDDAVNRLAPLETHLGNGTDGVDKYLRAAIKMYKGEYSGALSLLGNCIVNTSEDKYCRVLKIMIEAKQAGGYSAAHISELEAIAADEDNCGHAQARAILSQELDMEWDIEIHNDPPGLRSLEYEIPTEKPGLLQAQPNPANQTVWITYRNEEGASKIELEIFDPMGRLILSKDVTSGKGIFEWNTSGIAEGIYLMQLKFDSRNVGTEKVTIQH